MLYLVDSSLLKGNRNYSPGEEIDLTPQEFTIYRDRVSPIIQEQKTDDVTQRSDTKPRATTSRAKGGSN